MRPSPRATLPLVVVLLAAILAADTALLCRSAGPRLECTCRRFLSKESLARSCSHPSASAIHETFLYDVAIDTLYLPGGRRSSWADDPRVLLEAETFGALAQLGSPAALSVFERLVPRAELDTLLLSYRAENQTRGSLRRRLRLGDPFVLLDSARVTRYLQAPELFPELLPRADRGAEPPGVLTFSNPGVSRSGTRALLYVVLRSPGVRAPPHVVAAAFLILDYDGRRWRLRHEIPADPSQPPHP